MPDLNVMGLVTMSDTREDGASCVQSFSFFSTKSVEELEEKRALNWQKKGQSRDGEKKTTKRV